MRKVGIIFISVFLNHYGLLTQALLSLLVLLLYLLFTARKRPFITDYHFDLDVLSTSTALITVYCGMFFLADKSESRIGLSSADMTSDVTFELKNKFILVAIIVGVNTIFFGYWGYRVFVSDSQGVRGIVMKVCPKAYLYIYSCNDSEKAFVER